MEEPQVCRTLTVPGRLDSLPAVCEFVAAASQALGLDSDSAYNVQLAVEEACANLVQHGATAPLAHPPNLDLEVCRAGRICTVTLRDQGVPFDPRTRPLPDLTPSLRKRRPGGLGIYLMRRLMDEVSYEVCDGVNTLTMTKRLP